MKRKVTAALEAWAAERNKKPLVLFGARQTGKTTSVLDFGATRYQSVVHVDFVRQPSLKAAFERSLDPKDIIQLLAALLRRSIEPEGTLLFFDEVQECDQAIASLKYFRQDAPEYDVIAAGSLLGVHVARQGSFPVGYVDMFTMHPMDFEEFCWALGENETALEMARACFKEEAAVPAVIHQKLMELLKYYLIVGGMPAAVARFAQTRDIAQVQSVQKDILKLYRADIVKYARNKAHVGAIFDAIPAELSKKNKRFKLSDLAKSARSERYESDFIWLADAGVAIPCYNVTELVAPLRLNRQHSVFKLFLCDTGLLVAMLGDGVPFKVLQGELDINWGAILENAFAQMLTANGFDALYYEKAKHGEIDFVVQKSGKVVPIEAKSGRIFRAHVALDNVLRVKEWGLDFAYVFCRENTTVEVEIPEGRDIQCAIAYMPWYMLAFLKPDTLPDSFVVELP